MTYVPDLNEFLRIAGPGSLVPVYREILADLETPVSAYMKLAEGEFGFLLESVEGGERLARYSFIGSNPYAVATFSPGRAVLHRADSSQQELLSADPLDLLQRELNRPVLGKPADLPRFLGGAVGFLGYECARLWERLPEADRDPLGVPDAVLMFVDTLLVFDHLRHRALALTHARVDSDPEAAYREAVERIDILVHRLAQPLPTPPADARPAEKPVEVESNIGRDAYCAKVEQAKEHIAAGDIIQAVVSQRFSRPTSATPLEVYRALRTVNPAPYMYFLELGDMAIVGASPELLVQVQDRNIDYHPIAGTRPRGISQEEDEALEAELRDDPKERAEHVMLVDLGRNDVGRVSEPGSVRVTQLLDVERYSRVMHLVSHVTGRLREGLQPVDALRACFPAGTVTGAPKIRAMQILADLEPDRRGPYAGAVGYFSHNGNLDTCITIRTILMKDGQAHVQAGAGIVADSVPETEYEETLNKAGAMLRALQLAEGFRRKDPAYAPTDR
ncbi:MAG: anthranilate synthase component I [Chloroflexota bacterium]|nr:anthranilate synthase component I [Chloroflexota bacterium]